MSRLSMMIAVLMTVWLAGCQTDKDRALGAGVALGLAQAVPLPELPADCRRKERSGVKAGDPLDTALIKTDNALGRANARVTRCAGWYDDYKAGLLKGDAP